MPKYASTTTLRRIRDAKPCKYGWTKLLAHLGKTEADDEPLDLLTVLDSNGLEHAIWVLSYAMPDDRLARHFQAWCAEQAVHLFERVHPGDMSVRHHIAVLRDDSAPPDARAAAQKAAWRAAWRAADAAAWACAWAARDAEDAAKGSAARRAAWFAAAGAARAAQERQLRLVLGEDE